MTNVPIRIYNQYTLALIGEVDYYEQAFFTRSLTGYGSFTIVINYNITNAYLFAKGTIVQFGSSVKKIGVIEDIQKGIGEDGKGSQILTITGVQAKGIFTRRIIIPGAGNDYYAQNDNAESVIKSTIADQCGATAPADRKFPLLNVIADSGRGGVYALQEFNTNLGTILTDIAESQDPYIGFELSLNAATAKLDFDIIVGLDRRDSQTVNPRVCFSSEFDTLRSATIKDQSSGYRNVIYVGGQGDGSDKTIVQVNDTVEPTGLDRREEYIDSSSLQSVADLSTAGASELNALKQATLTIEAQALVSSQLTYGVDYDIGDLVNIKEYGTVFDAQITEVTESWAHGSYEVSHVFGKQAQSITSVVKSTKSGLDQTNTSKSSIGWKTSTISYAITADVVQDYSDITADVIILTGAMGANRNLTLATPDTAGIGRKLYTLLVTATGGYTITVKTAAGGTGTVALVATGTPYTWDVFVDASGNVRSLGVATPAMAGLESAADKTKLDGIAAGAEVNLYPVSDESRLLDITGDGVPIFPDGAATYFRNKDWTVTTGWIGGSGNTLSIESMSLKIVATSGNPSLISSTSATYQNKLVRLIIKSDFPITNITTITGSTVYTAMNITAMGGGRYMADIQWSRSGSDLFAIWINYGAATAITWYLESIYIGTGAYTTPIYSKSCCNRLTNNGLLPVQSPFGLALRAPGAQYAVADNPVIGTIGTISLYFKRNLLGTNQYILNNSSGATNGMTLYFNTGNVLRLIFSNGTSIVAYGTKTFTDITTWHSVKIMSNGAVYYDGVLSTDTVPTTWIQGLANLRIGSVTSSEFFVGDFIIRADGRVESATDVAAWHNDPRSVDSQQKAITNLANAIKVCDSKGNIREPGLLVYADNTAALAGGLVAGEKYRTSTGIVMVVY